LMADLFTRLAQRTLETGPRLAVRLPSRFDPARGLQGDAAIAQEIILASDRSSSEGSGAPGPLVRSRKGEGLLPRRQFHDKDASTKESLEERAVARSTGTPFRRGQTVLEDAPGSTDSRGPTASTDGSHRQDSPNSEPEGNEPRPEALAADERRPPGPSQETDVSPADHEAGPPKSAVPRVADSDLPSSRSEDLSDLERRLRPLLPRQPELLRSVSAFDEGRGGDRSDRQSRLSSPPAIEVTIGSVEIRAAVPAAPASPSDSGPSLTLTDYLKRRDRGGP
jgi:hypothetical protein